MSRPNLIAFVAISCLLVMFSSAVPLNAQHFEVIHTFTGQGDGAGPWTGLTPLGSKFVGTNYSTIFELESAGGSWVLDPLIHIAMYPYSDGEWPMGKVVIGPDGALYGTTYNGGQTDSCPNGNGCGIVYKVTPPLTVCRSFSCPWTETVLHTFTGGADGGGPTSEVVFDHAGNLYGTTPWGGSMACPYGCGVVYEMTPSAGGWTQTVIYSFTGGADGRNPEGGLTFDAAGNLYGVALGGSDQAGVIFKLTPSAGGWTQSVLHDFQGTDGAAPETTMIWDAAGNLYGVTYGGGTYGWGTAFEFSPTSGNLSLLYSFNPMESNPTGSPAFDTAGNLYGVTNIGDSYTYGVVYKLTHTAHGWVGTDLYRFTGGADGSTPEGSVVFDGQGRIYGTASMGGSAPGGCGCGTIWRITP